MNESEVYPWARLSTDANGDGSFTISDLPAWLFHWLLLPGDSVLYWLLAYLPGVADFLELSESDYGGPFAIGLSVMLWLIALVCVGVILNVIHDFDRRLTASVAGRLNEARRQLRVLRRRSSVWASAWLKGRGRKVEGMRVEPLMLDPVERSVLRCLTSADDGAVLTIDELSARLNRSTQEIRAAYDRLCALDLVERGRDRAARREGFRITTAGQMYLIGN